MKTIKINNEEYIKKSEYLKLKESKCKTKIVKDNTNYLIPDPSNCLGLIHIHRIKNLEEKWNVKFSKYNEEVVFLNPYTKDHIFPRVKIKNTIFDYRFFIQANHILELLGFRNGYDIMLANEDTKPCILICGDMGIVISPRDDGNE